MVESSGSISNNTLLAGDGLFTIPSKNNEKARLIGSKCESCGEVVFPVKKRCPNCSSEETREVLLGPTGKLYSFTVLYQLPPAGYQGPVPYGVAKVEMAEGTRITGYCTENDPSKLTLGMEMELIVDKLFTDSEKLDVIGFKFRPLSNGER